MGISIARGRLAWPAGLFALGLLTFMTAGHAVGLFSVLGYEKRHVTFSGFASGTSSGGGLGLKDMLFFEGQTFYAQYDTQIRTGSLRIGILCLVCAGDHRPHFVESITDSGAGEVSYKIPATGLYSIYFNGSVRRAAKGYDLTYAVAWGAR